MVEAGGLIKLHYHRNYDLLELFDDYRGVLYYNGRSLFDNVEISQEEHNHLTKKIDGLFVDGTFLDRFSYSSQTEELYFDSIIVSREYTDKQITDMVDTLWVTNPYHVLGKIDLTYWFVHTRDTAKSQEYTNKNRIYDMNIRITNPGYNSLRITNGENSSVYNNYTINLVLEANTSVFIERTDFEDMTITVELIQE